MSQGALRTLEGGGLALEGVIDMTVGTALRETGRRLLAACPQEIVRIDCAGITHSSSVGLSLLLCLMRDARAAGRRLAVYNLPPDMRQIAEMYGLLELLPLAD